MNIYKLLTVMAFVVLCLATIVLTKMILEKSNTMEVKVETVETTVTHAQDTWERALEWCESRGLLEAVNPEDLDGTPSYYSWQWKPETFLGYAIKYGLVDKQTTLSEAKEMMRDYSLQKRTLDGMIPDKDVVWRHEFPDCVKKLGGPPKY